MRQSVTGTNRSVRSATGTGQARAAPTGAKGGALRQTDTARNRDPASVLVASRSLEPDSATRPRPARNSTRGILRRPGADRSRRGKDRPMRGRARPTRGARRSSRGTGRSTARRATWAAPAAESGIVTRTASPGPVFPPGAARRGSPDISSSCSACRGVELGRIVRRRVGCHDTAGAHRTALRQPIRTGSFASPPGREPVPSRRRDGTCSFTPSGRRPARPGRPRFGRRCRRRRGRCPRRGRPTPAWSGSGP